MQAIDPQPKQGTTSVKICGIKQIELLRSILHLPIDQIGFVFAPSKRQITPQLASEMISELQHLHKQGASVPQAVGVFVNPTKEELTQILSVAALDVVQLHGAETPEFCRWVKESFALQVFKVVSVSSTCRTSDPLVTLEPYIGAIDAVLLDTYDPVVGGGTGETFAWDCIPEYLAWTRKAGLRLIVAGGLHPENVAQLISSYHPDGVDVSSGVETENIKDAGKIQTFVERVKGL